MDTKKKKLLLSALVIVIAALSVLSYFSFVFLPDTQRVNFSAEEIEKRDFSAQAQAYLEYFGNNLKHRSGFIMNTKYDTLEVLNQNYPGRSSEHFRLYSPLLSALIMNPNM